MITTILFIVALFVFIWVVAPIAADCKYETITCRCGQCQIRAAIVFDDAEANGFATTLTTNCPVCIGGGMA